VSERLSGNIEEGCSALRERRGVVVPVRVSMLSWLEGGGFRAVVLIEGVSGSFCGRVKHKLGGKEEHGLRSSTR